MLSCKFCEIFKKTLFLQNNSSGCFLLKIKYLADFKKVAYFRKNITKTYARKYLV